MVTDNRLEAGREEFMFYGKSTDTKPTTQVEDGTLIKNGSKFYEMDTSDVYMYDEEDAAWLLQQ